MFYYLYKITNWYNGKIYVGYHQTKNLDDRYMGSGKYLKRAIKKYGQEYFTKDILQFFDSPEEMKNAESILVNEEFIQDPMTYNIKLGGEGQWNHCNEKRTIEEQNDLAKLGGLAFSDKFNNDLNFRKIHLDKLINEIKNNHVLGKYKYNTFEGKTHSLETKLKMSQSHKQNYDKTKHHNFGKIWIYNEILQISKTIFETELYLLDNNWKKGRKIFKHV